MNVKYQVFISSTYEDLKQERDQVIKAVLEMGHIPVGMEMFSAADEEQWQLIARQIDQSDYYMAIVANRYGSTVEGLSYTEKEYDYAVLSGVPVLGFIIEESAVWPGDRMEDDPAKKLRLDAFKEKLRQKPVGSWSSADDLHGKFSIALMKQMTSNPRTGWARASDVAGPQVMVELSRLSSENANLRAALSDEVRKAEEEVAVARKKTIRALLINKVETAVWYNGGTGWEDESEVTLLQVFNIIAPELMVEISITRCALFVAFIIRKDRDRKALKVPLNYLKLWLSDLMTLGLVAPSDKRHPVADKEEYWTLTDEGKELHLFLRRLRLELGEERTVVPDPEVPEIDVSVE